jgi:hypothetical protein
MPSVLFTAHNVAFLSVPSVLFTDHMISIGEAIHKICRNKILLKPDNMHFYLQKKLQVISTEYIRKHFSKQHWNMQWHYNSDVMNYNYSMENKRSGKSLKKCVTKILSEVPRKERK